MDSSDIVFCYKGAYRFSDRKSSFKMEAQFRICVICSSHADALCPPIDNIITLMTVWRITWKIIGTTIMLITYARV